MGGSCYPWNVPWFLHAWDFSFLIPSSGLHGPSVRVLLGMGHTVYVPTDLPLCNLPFLWIIIMPYMECILAPPWFPFLGCMDFSLSGWHHGSLEYALGSSWLPFLGRHHRMYSFGYLPNLELSPLASSWIPSLVQLLFHTLWWVVVSIPWWVNATLPPLGLKLF